MAEEAEHLFDHRGGTAAPWYQARDLTDDQRSAFRERALRSRAAKLAALDHDGPGREIYVPVLDPADLMPSLSSHGLPALSLFSGGGGLDLGFERAGFAHLASYDTLEAAGDTLRDNRPEWNVYSGHDGDVRRTSWRHLRGEVGVLHGGPPCQPFSVAGRQRGESDERNMLPEFVRAVSETQPLAFVAENVPALAGPKFAPYLDEAFVGPLSREYTVIRFRLSAHMFGVPQVRHRVFFVGFRHKRAANRFVIPIPTHRADHLTKDPAPLSPDVPPTMGVRAALGLPDIGHDALAPTLRSTLTGPRHTTSILSSASAQKVWAALEIWPNGVAKTRAKAALFDVENGHHRLAVADCALIQGFPSWWRFSGATYMSLGQVGNSVAPPVAYAVAVAVAAALGVRD